MAFTLSNFSCMAYTGGPAGVLNHLWFYMVPQGDTITADFYFNITPSAFNGVVKGDFIFASDGKALYVDEAAAAAAAAENTITIVTAENAGNDETVTINGVVYTFKTTLSTTPTVDGEVKIGATTADTFANLVKALNGVTDAEAHSVEASHPTVTDKGAAEVVDDDTVLTLQARKTGEGGNDYTLAKVGVHISVGAATFSGGRVVGSVLTSTINT